MFLIKKTSAKAWRGLEGPLERSNLFTSLESLMGKGACRSIKSLEPEQHRKLEKEINRLKNLE